MRHSEDRADQTTAGEGTLPIDFGDDKIQLVREVHAEGPAIVSDEAGEEHRLAERLPHGQVGIDAAYAQARPIFERAFAAQHATVTEVQQPDRTFAQAEPNYRAGFTAGRDLRFADQTFETIEAELRREYESSIASEQDEVASGYERPWERMRDEIQRGFQEARRHD